MKNDTKIKAESLNEGNWLLISHRWPEKSLTTVTVIILYKSERDERLKGSRLPTLFMFIKWTIEHHLVWESMFYKTLSTWSRFVNKTSPELEQGLNFCQHLDFVTVAAFLENDHPSHWLWENGLDEDKNPNTHVAPWKWKWPRIKRIWILTFPHENAGWVTNVFARLKTHLQLLAFYQNCWKARHSTQCKEVDESNTRTRSNE